MRPLPVSRKKLTEKGGRNHNNKTKKFVSFVALHRALMVVPIVFTKPIAQGVMSRHTQWAAWQEKLSYLIWWDA